jgi:hypothetical protein
MSELETLPGTVISRMLERRVPFLSDILVGSP